MARIINQSITGNGTSEYNLKNIRRGERNTYTACVSGTFDSGTITAFVKADGTNNIAILDASGNAVSFTENGVFNFEANSDQSYPLKLVIVLAGATSPSINLNVFNGA